MEFMGIRSFESSLALDIHKEERLLVGWLVGDKPQHFLQFMKQLRLSSCQVGGLA